MAFEDIPGKSSESDLGGSKRKPTRLPIPIQAGELHMQEPVHNIAEKADSTERKKRKRRKKRTTETTATTEAAPVEKQPQAKTKRSESNSTPEVVADSTETVDTHVKITEKATEKLAVPESADEAEPAALEELHAPESLHADDDFSHIPLHEQEAAADLFISPRLHAESEREPANETTAHTGSRWRRTATAATPAAAAAGTASAAHSPVHSPANPNFVPPAVPNPNTPFSPNVAPPVAGANIPPMPPTPPQGPNFNVAPPGGGGFGGNVAPAPAAANIAPVAAPHSGPERTRTAERGWDAKSLWAGIIIGGVIEHVRHKRKQKRRDKVHAGQVKELQKGHQATQEQLRQTEAKAERTKTSLEKQLDRLKQLVVPIPVPTPPRPERPQMQQTVPKYEAPAPVPRQAQAERASANPLLAPLPANPETKTPLPQNAPEKQNPDIAPEIPKDHKVESSAWHHIEIDKKTGKAVEAPTVAYGEEFKREQHQEQLRRAIDEASISSDTVRQQYAAPLGSGVSNSAQHDDRNKQAAQGKPAAILHHAKQTVQRAEPVDIALWVGLGIVMLAIIAVLF